MASIGAVIDRWLDTLESRRGRNGRYLENLAGSNVYGSGRTLYSYGRHFPLAQYFPRERGRPAPLFVLNGDRVSSSTSRHQSETRSAVARRAPGLGADTLLVPFSALESARIDRASIRPLEIRPDAWLIAESEPVESQLDEPETAAERVESTRYRYGGRLGDSGSRDVRIYRWRERGYTFERIQWPDSDEPGRPTIAERPFGAGWRELERDERGEWRLIRRVHRLGDSVFTALVSETRRRRRACTVSDVISAALVTARNQTAAHERDRRERIHLTRLGESLARNGRARDGLELLSDPLALLDVSAPIVESVPVRVRRRFVSSFDTNEPAPLYFLATLPARSRARTVETALEDLAPAAVHAALARGRDVRRQGDIFAIRTSLTDRDVATFERARLTLWTRGARPRLGEPGYSAPVRAAEWRRIRARARELWRAEWRAPDERASHYVARARARPETSPHARRAWRELHARRARDVETARASGRSAILRAVFEPGSLPGAYFHRAPTLRGLESARTRELHARRMSDANGYTSRRHARDRYRPSNYTAAGAALELWRDCLTAALHELRPALRPANVDRARARAREILSVYGTSHSATEVARGPGGAVYLRGTMRHVPGLEPGRIGGRDHRDVRLGTGAEWYLAVRNAVPRSRDGRP